MHMFNTYMYRYTHLKDVYPCAHPLTLPHILSHTYCLATSVIFVQRNFNIFPYWLAF